MFEGADASGFEEDARLTAMWLWTLSAGQMATENWMKSLMEKRIEEAQAVLQQGYVLEYDAAGKIAQGLGAHLESLTSLVEIKGETARLLLVSLNALASCSERMNQKHATSTQKEKSPNFSLGFVAELEQAEEAGSWGSKGAPAQGATVLDRVHQSMILFAAGRGEALRRFLGG